MVRFNMSNRRLFLLLGGLTQACDKLKDPELGMHFAETMLKLFGTDFAQPENESDCSDSWHEIETWRVAAFIEAAANVLHGATTEGAMPTYEIEAVIVVGEPLWDSIGMPPYPITAEKKKMIEEVIIASAPKKAKKPNPGKPFPNIGYDNLGFGGRLGLGDTNDN